MDAIPSRFISELPEEKLEKNEQSINDNPEDFEFNPDMNEVFEDNSFRSPGWERFRKKKLIKWKKSEK